MFDYIIDENLFDLIKSDFKLFIAFTQQKYPDYHVVTNEPPMKSCLRIFFQNRGIWVENQRSTTHQTVTHTSTNYCFWCFYSNNLHSTIFPLSYWHTSIKKSHLGCLICRQPEKKLTKFAAILGG